jgi:hypothetical protein
LTSLEFEEKKTLGILSLQASLQYVSLLSINVSRVSNNTQGGSLAVRGGLRSMRNSAIGCAVLLAVIEGVGIGFQRMMAENTALQPPAPPPQASDGKVYL